MTLEEFENTDEGWVEWPSFPENEERFDWSLSYEEMERRWPSSNSNATKKKKKLKPFNYKSSTSFPDPILARRDKEVKKAHYVNYMGKDCPCVGFIDRSFSLTGLVGVKQYQNAYYHSGEEKYLFEVVYGIVAYPKERVEKYIKPFFPKDEEKIVSGLPTIKTITQNKNLNTNISSGVRKNHDKYYDQQRLDKSGKPIIVLSNKIETADEFLKRRVRENEINRMLSKPAPNFHY